MIQLDNLSSQDILIFLALLLGAIVAMLITRKLLRISFPYFFMGILGLVSGLWVGSRLGLPFADLPAPYGRLIPMAINIIIAVAILDLFLAQARQVGMFFSSLFDILQRWLTRLREIDPRPKSEIILDTSALIDGRLEEIARTGFIMGKVVVPKFVLAELQHVADHADSLKRSRGRRGLEVLSGLQKMSELHLELADEFLLGPEEVDRKLIRLAKQRPAKILTVDYNLAQVAQIEGIEVLNVNELATALRPTLLPGETLAVTIIQKGKERGQGIGYLTDGTMIVVEGGASHVGETLTCEVVRIFQSVTGKMVFVEPVSSSQTDEA